MFTASLDLKEFNQALATYLLVNKREASGLVEHTARKVVTGFSPRSPSAKKVKGLRQFFYDKRATATKIRSEFKARESQGIGTLRPPFHYVSRRARSTVRYRSKKAAINWRARRGKAWLQATMLYPHWRATPEPKNKTFSPKPRQHGGAKPDTRVIIKTNAQQPYVIWKSAVPGVAKGKYINKAIQRALRDGKDDMMVYIKRKIQNIKI
jgi:hypothetical protein